MSVLSSTAHLIAEATERVLAGKSMEGALERTISPLSEEFARGLQGLTRDTNREISPRLTARPWTSNFGDTSQTSISPVDVIARSHGHSTQPQLSQLLDGASLVAPEQQARQLSQALRKMAPELKKNGIEPTEFFRSSTDAKTFLSARENLVSLGETYNANRGAAAIASLFGDDGKTWLTHASRRGIGTADAIGILPFPSRIPKDGLAKYILEQTEPLTKKQIDDNHVLFQMKAIGADWNKVREEDMKLPPNDLFFQLKTGMPLTHFRNQPERALSISFSPKDEIFKDRFEATVNNVAVGHVNFHVNLPEVHVDELRVEPGFRGFSIGTRLLQATEQSVDRQITRMGLKVAAVNRRAQALYSRLGFEYDGTDLSMRRMVKPISR
jgi:ribosomal protein S18 acetylase RimI-like enzyme